MINISMFFIVFMVFYYIEVFGSTWGSFLFGDSVCLCFCVLDPFLARDRKIEILGVTLEPERYLLASVHPSSACGEVCGTTNFSLSRNAI